MEIWPRKRSFCTQEIARPSWPVLCGALPTSLLSFFAFSNTFFFFFFLEYAGELRIIVLKGEEESYIDSHTDTLKTHTEHTHPHAQGKQKTQDHLLFRAPETQLRPDQSVNG